MEKSFSLPPESALDSRNELDIIIDMRIFLGRSFAPQKKNTNISIASIKSLFPSSTSFLLCFGIRLSGNSRTRFSSLTIDIDSLEPLLIGWIFCRKGEKSSPKRQNMGKRARKHEFEYWRWGIKLLIIKIDFQFSSNIVEALVALQFSSNFYLFSPNLPPSIIIIKTEKKLAR